MLRLPSFWRKVLLPSPDVFLPKRRYAPTKLHNVVNHNTTVLLFTTMTAKKKPSELRAQSGTGSGLAMSVRSVSDPKSKIRLSLNVYDLHN